MIQNLDPKLVWKSFNSLTQIPRPSKKEGKIREFFYNYGKNLGLETIQDEIGNIIITKPATAGMENIKGVILQGHMDMVPQKNADTEHDFEKDPISTFIEGDWVKAKGTTLGADNGIGLAMAMAVLESTDIKHGPIEVLITTDEETGMTGARELKSGILKGDILINLDSETEGELYVGCAGGLDVSAKFKYSELPAPADFVSYKLNVKGFVGGHSGMDIILCRGNANVIAARVLIAIMEAYDVRLSSIDGGSLRNAIPRESFAEILIPAPAVAEVEATIAKIKAEVKAEYIMTDPDADIFIEKLDSELESYIEDEIALDAVKAVYSCPEGVERMSDQMPGLVETSNNLAIVKSVDGEIQINTLMRSSVDTAKAAYAEKIRVFFELAGAEVDFEGGYSGWAPNSSSAILHTMKEVYQNLYGKEPAIMAIHAGLECGILSGAYPHWDMISCGPTILSPHSPDERLNIPSVEKCWNFLKAVLENIPTK